MALTACSRRARRWLVPCWHHSDTYPYHARHQRISTIATAMETHSPIAVATPRSAKGGKAVTRVPRMSRARPSARSPLMASASGRSSMAREKPPPCASTIRIIPNRHIRMQNTPTATLSTSHDALSDPRRAMRMTAACGDFFVAATPIRLAVMAVPPSSPDTATRVASPMYQTVFASKVSRPNSSNRDESSPPSESRNCGDGGGTRFSETILHAEPAGHALVAVRGSKRFFGRRRNSTTTPSASGRQENRHTSSPDRATISDGSVDAIVCAAVAVDGTISTGDWALTR